MKSIALSIALIAWLGASAAAAPRVHPEGFSLDVPADWKLSESPITLGMRWIASKIDPKNDKIGVIVSVYPLTQAEIEPTVTNLADYYKISDLTWGPAQKTTFDGISGTKRTGKAKHYDFTALVLETSVSKRILVVAMQIGADRQHRLELELLLASIKRVAISTTTFPLSDGVGLDLPVTWGVSKGDAPKPFDDMEWLFASSMDKQTPKVVILMRAIDKDKLDAGLKAWEDEDKADLGAVAWGAPTAGTVNGVRVTTRQGKQAGTPITLVVVETSPTKRFVLWGMSIGRDTAALEPQLKAVLGTLRKR